MNKIVFVHEDSTLGNQTKFTSNALYLRNPLYKIYFFKVIPKTFIISTNNGSFHFNTEMMIDTSSVISEFIQQNPDNYQYHLDLNDENNVFEKIEQIYQGNYVIFEENELSILNQIKNSLNLYSIPSCERNIYYRESVYFSSVIISRQSFYNFLSNSSFQTFKIITKNQFYYCNKFGILSSKILSNFLLQNPENDEYHYDFDDEFTEFQFICDFFNFKIVEITPDNMNNLKGIAEDLQIEFILEDINKYISEYEELKKTFDEQQSIVDSISELFDYLYNIDSITVFQVKKFVIESEWSSSIEKVQELAAFVLQVVKSDFNLHHAMIDLLFELDSEGEERKELATLVPFIVSKLMNSFGETKHNCSFIYNLWKKGFIPYEDIEIKLIDSYFNKSTEKTFDNILDWFFPEIVQMAGNEINAILYKYDEQRRQFFLSFLPDKLDEYKEMLDSGEPTEKIAKLLRLDDVNELKLTIIKDKIDIFKSVVPYNIYEDYIQNGHTNFLNYAAAYGSIKCFKFLLLNHVDVDPLSFEYSIFGGNTEIIRIVDSKSQDFTLQVKRLIPTNAHNKIIPSIVKHRYNLFDWLLDEKIDKTQELFNDLAIDSMKSGNGHSLFQMIVKGYNIFEHQILIQYSAENGFYLLSKLFLNILTSKIKNPDFLPIVQSFMSFGNLSIFELFSRVINQNEFKVSFRFAVEHNYLNFLDFMFANLFNKKFEMQIISINEAINISVQKKEDDIFYYLFDKIKSTNPLIFDKIDWCVDILPNACKNNKKDIVKTIIEKTFNKNEASKYNITSSIIQAVKANSIEICRYLTNTPFVIDYVQLSSSGNKFNSIKVEIFSLLIEKAPNLTNEFLNNFIYPSIRNENKSLVEYILKQNSKYEDSLIEAAKVGNIELVNIILEYNSEPYLINRNTQEGTPLFIASEFNYINIVQRLLSMKNIDPSLSNSDGKTPLQIAMINKNAQIVCAILDWFGDDINSYPNEINTLITKEIDFLHNICQFSKEHQENIQKILSRIIEIKNIDPNIIHNGYSFLFHCCVYYNKEICEKLLKLDNIDPNIRLPSDGCTPLMISLMENNLDIAEMLINHEKTNTELKNHKDISAAIIAVAKNQEKIIELLIDKEDSNALLCKCNQFFAEPANVKEGLKYLKKALEKRNPTAMLLEGFNLMTGLIDEPNKEEACKYFKMAADNGETNGMLNYAFMLYSGEGIEENKEESYKYLKMAADKGNKESILFYGNMIFNGNEINEEICHYIKDEAFKGNILAMFKYSYMLENGIYFETNEEEANKYYQKVKDECNAEEMFQYGLRFNSGYTLPNNQEEASRFFKLAADKGHVNAMLYYGLLLCDETNNLVNKKEAVKYIKMAADHGNVLAMRNYGIMLHLGYVIEANKDEEECKYFKMAADKGDIDSMFYYANTLEKIYGNEGKQEERCKYYKMAADQGHKDAMFNYGFMLHYGKGVENNKEESCKYFKMAADKGNLDGMFFCGSLLLERKRDENDLKEALKYFKIAADQGHTDAMINYGYMLIEGKGVESNKEEACKYYKMAADRGNLNAMLFYGSFLSEGKIIAKNIKEACKYFKMAADKGSEIGMNNYAWFLYISSDANKDYEEIIKYFKMAIEKDHMTSMVNYAFFLDNGFGVPVDHDEANKYYKTVIEKGGVQIICKFANILEKGLDTDKNEKEACRYYKIAADAGYVDAIVNYARMLENGIGTPVNSEEAIRYDRMAAEKGSEEAIEICKKI